MSPGVEAALRAVHFGVVCAKSRGWNCALYGKALRRGGNHPVQGGGEVASATGVNGRLEPRILHIERRPVERRQQIELLPGLRQFPRKEVGGGRELAAIEVGVIAACLY